MPPGTQVIDLANDTPVSSSTTNSTTTGTALRVNPLSPSTLPASSPHQESSTLTALSDSTTHISRSPSHDSHPSQVANPAFPAQLRLKIPAAQASNTIISAVAVLSSNLSASDLSAPTPSLMQGQQTQTDACLPGSEKSSSDPASSVVPAPVPGVSEKLRFNFSLMLVIQLNLRCHQTPPTLLCHHPHTRTSHPAKWMPQRLHSTLCKMARMWIRRMGMGNKASDAG